MLSKQGKALMGPSVGNGGGDSFDDPAVMAELRNNPYFQNMIENYANLIGQQQQQQQQQKPSPGRPTNQGPSWC
jgi:hypothetical protein